MSESERVAPALGAREGREGARLGSGRRGPGRSPGLPLPNLARLRNELGISQEALAARAGCSRGTVKRAEGGGGVDWPTAANLAAALGTAVERLTGELQPR